MGHPCGADHASDHRAAQLALSDAARERRRHPRVERGIDRGAQHHEADSPPEHLPVGALVDRTQAVEGDPDPDARVVAAGVLEVDRAVAVHELVEPAAVAAAVLVRVEAADRVGAAYGYEVRYLPVGADDPEVGPPTQMAVFALGIMPYITSSIIMQLLTVVIPKLEAWSKEGESGYKKITQWTRYLTVVLAVLQSTGLAFLFHRGNITDPQGNPVDLFPPGGFTPARVGLLVISLTAGTALIMWLGELITQRGIGNGMSILIFASIISTLPSEGKAILDQKGLPFFIVICLIALAVIVARPVAAAQVMRERSDSESRADGQGREIDAARATSSMPGLRSRPATDPSLPTRSRAATRSSARRCTARRAAPTTASSPGFWRRSPTRASDASSRSSERSETSSTARSPRSSSCAPSRTRRRP